MGHDAQLDGDWKPSSWDYVPEYGDRPPPWRRLLVERILRLSARRRPHETAVICGDRTLTWLEFDRLADRAADGLLRSGLRPGAVVALSATNLPETFAMMFGIARAGMVVLPLNPMNSPKEIAFQISEAGADLTISAAGPTVLDVIDRGRPDVVHEADVEETSPYWVRFTSGTTGLPRMFPNSQRNISLQALHMALDLRYRSDDTFLVNAPLAHAAFNFALASVQAGAKVVLHEKFDPENIWRDCARQGVTQMFMVPTMLAAALQHPGEAPDLRTAFVTGAALAPTLKKAATERFPHVDFTELYGASELGMLALLRGDESDGREGSAGLPHFASSIRILDEEGRQLPAGEVGTVYLQGIIMTSGFNGSVPAPENSVRDGWVTSGDMGHLDEDGYLYLADRRSDLILTGGMNVYPAEVENVLLQAPGVREVAVVGTPDDYWGQKVTAVVVGDADQEALDAHCRELLAAYKIPRHYRFVEVLPTSPTGKVLRRLLREETQK
ncbi:acyl-CoA synthetase [Streptomyces chlorus]|uniref:Class I adenylate-forming enzyme family protein n=1 Tax=Streptomyces chlorus TaxID=887452 RepID=A0ABW1DZT0_9ACTN